MILIVLNIVFFITLILGFSLFIALYPFIFLPLKLINPRNGIKAFRYGMWLGGRLILKILVRPILRTSFINEGNFQFDKPCVMVINHNASSDAFFMGLLPPLEAVMVVKAWPFKIPLIGFVAKKAGYIKIDDRSPEAFVEEGINMIKNGVSVIVFPEGTRSNSETLRPFYSLAFKIALETKVPIIPMCLTGNENSPKRGSLLLQFAHVRLQALSPILPELFERWNMNAYHLKSYTRHILQEKLDQIHRREKTSLLPFSQILEIMPHKPPMLLLEKLIESNEESATLETSIRDTNVFLQSPGVADELIFPELIAQSSALNESYQKKNQKQEGFIVSIKNFAVKRRARLGEHLIIRVKRTHQFENLSVIEGIVSSGEEILATGEVGIWKR